MSITYTPKDAVIDVVAVALILAPEPASTAIGIAMLARPRGTSQSETKLPRRTYPEYVYKIDNIRGREITWEVRTIHAGQLPLMDLNRPAVQIKSREQFIRSRTAPEKSAAQRRAENLPPGVKVHHEIFRPGPSPVKAQAAFIPGETIHHTLRQMPQPGQQSSRQQPSTGIHHTIANSPGYRRAQAGGGYTGQQSGVIHHTIRESPAARGGNPANIVKTVRIVEHHTINPDPRIPYKGRLIRQIPLIPPSER
ncbi:MAG: hypothetical protein JW901_06360 [Dehalococcoidia bacterium]|nr:hypothetical protein [Dehalococcoidia bacterium]